jgi:putative membrane protein
MNFIARLLTTLVALAHVGFLVLEMFLWTGPIGQRVFAMTPEFAAQSAVLAANQGLYNGFLAAGLLWGALRNDRAFMIFSCCACSSPGSMAGSPPKSPSSTSKPRRRSSPCSRFSRRGLSLLR